MTPACTPEQRARQIEAGIWKLVDRGELALANGTYGRLDCEGKCCACAIGSAARTVGLLKFNEGGFRISEREALVDGLAARGVCTLDESLAMERGFEGGSGIREYAWDRFEANGSTITTEAFAAFFDLGLRLRDRRRPA